MKYKLKPYMIIILILCILVGIYFLWPIITDETDSVLVEEGVNGNSSISNVAEISNKPIAYITGAVVSPGLYELESSSNSRRCYQASRRTVTVCRCRVY